MDGENNVSILLALLISFYQELFFLTIINKNKEIRLKKELDGRARTFKYMVLKSVNDKGRLTQT